MSAKKIQILVVDDVKEIRDLLCRFLVDRGFSVLSAGSGEEALPVIIGQKPQVLLLDYGLPGMNGLELLKLVREFNSTIAVIMISGSAIDLKSDPQFKRLGVRDFFSKPMNLMELDSALRQVIEQ